MGVTSRMERICSPAVASAWIADSRPDPGPCTRTCTRRTPRFIASRAACSAATVAATPPAIRPDVHQPLDVHRDVGAQRAFHLVVALDHLPQPGHLRVAEIAHPRVRVHPRLRENLLRVAGTDAEDVRQGVLDFLLARQVDACNACHDLALPLLVLRIALSDYADHAAAADHLAMLADRSNARAHLHRAVSTTEPRFPVSLEQ